MSRPGDPRPHWAQMTADGGPTYPDDEAVLRWRAAAFAKSRRFVEDTEPEGQAGLFTEGGG